MFHPKLHSALELEALVRRMGFLPFFRCSIPQFSIEEFTPGRYWFADGVEGPWEWRMELARRGVVAYGKLFAKKAGLVSREWYPDLANYRRGGYDFDARYEDGLAGYREKRVMDVLLRDGPTLSRDLKRLAGFGGDGMKGFDTVITSLQMQTYVTVHSFEYAHDKYGRPVTLAACQNDFTKDVITRAMDVCCANRYYGRYNLIGDLDAACDAWNTELDFWAGVGKPLLVTEYGADSYPGVHNTHGEMFSEEYRMDCDSRINAKFDKRPFFVGEQVWSFAGFAAVQGPMRVDGNRKGLFTRDRRPKLAAHYFRRRWRSIPDFGYKG